MNDLVDFYTAVGAVCALLFGAWLVEKLGAFFVAAFRDRRGRHAGPRKGHDHA